MANLILAAMTMATVAPQVPAEFVQGITPDPVLSPTIEFTTAMKVTANGTRLVTAMLSELMSVPHVDGAYRCDDRDGAIDLVVVAERHGLIDRERLFVAEDRLSSLSNREVSIRVLAHQGRPVSSLSSSGLLFDRGDAC